jgi:hypothetical protein
MVTPFGFGFAFVFLQIVVLLQVAVAADAYWQTAAFMLVPGLELGFLVWCLMPVRLRIELAGIRVGGRTIPWQELDRCEVEHEGPYRVRLLLYTKGGIWRSPELNEHRARVELVATAITAVRNTKLEHTGTPPSRLADPPPNRNGRIEDP